MSAMWPASAFLALDGSNQPTANISWGRKILENISQLAAGGGDREYDIVSQVHSQDGSSSFSPTQFAGNSFLGKDVSVIGFLDSQGVVNPALICGPAAPGTVNPGDIVLADPINSTTASMVFGQNGNLRIAGSLGVGNAAAATTPGSVVKKIEVFDASGTSLGFIPVYSSIA